MDFVELEVRRYAGSTPEIWQEKDRPQTGEHEGPPFPVAGNALAPQLFGGPVRRVRREGGGNHREAGQPPRYAATRRQELGVQADAWFARNSAGNGHTMIVVVPCEGTG